jgi:hypothetical protein
VKGVTQKGSGSAPPPFKEADREFDKGPASETVLSLSQALLAPLDAILKAQVHAARSFLNLLLQIGYPHQPVLPSGGPVTPTGASTGGASGASPGAAAPPGDPTSPTGAAPPGTPAGGSEDDGIPYEMEFYHDVPNVGRHKVSVPTLALVPLNPLGVKEAEFQFDFYVRQISRHTQIMASEKEAVAQEQAATEQSAAGPMDRQTRPWYLVETPLSIRGTFAPSPPQGQGADVSHVDDARFHVDVKVGSLPLPAALEKLMVSLGQISRMEQLPPTKP